MKYYSTSKQSSWPKDILRLYQVCKAKGACPAGLTRFVDLLYSWRPKSLKELWKAACVYASASDLRYVLHVTPGLNIRKQVHKLVVEYILDNHHVTSVRAPKVRRCSLCPRLLERSRTPKHYQEVLNTVGPYEVADIKRLFPDPFRGWYKKQQKRQQKKQQKQRRVKT